MTRPSDPAAAPQDLLAAYADDGLDAGDRIRVEAYLAAHPEAAAELVALRGLLAEARATAPRPRQEPAWDDMARAIRAACADQPLGAGASGLLARATAWLRGRPVLAGGLGTALVAAAVILALRAGDGSTPARAPVAVPAPDAEDDLALAVELPGLEQAWEDGSDLDVLATLYDDGEGDGDGDDDTADDDDGLDLLPDDALPEELIDDLSDEELELLDTHLQLNQAG